MCLSLFPHLREAARRFSSPPGAAASPLCPGPADKGRGSAPAATGPLPTRGLPPAPAPGRERPPRCRALPALRGERKDETNGAPLEAPAAPLGRAPPPPAAAPSGAGRGADGARPCRPAERGSRAGPSIPCPPHRGSGLRPHTAPPPLRPRRPRPALTAGRCDPPALSGGGGPGAGGPCRGPAAATARLLRRRRESLPPAVPPRPVSMCGAAALPSEHVPEPAHTRALRAGRGSGADPLGPPGPAAAGHGASARRWEVKKGVMERSILWSLAGGECVRC